MFTKPMLPAAHQPKPRRTRSAGPDKASMHRRIDSLEAQVNALEGHIGAMQQSTSWRISAPVRWLSRQLQRIRGREILDSTQRADTYAEWIRLYDTVAPSPQAGAFVAAQDDRAPRMSIFLIANAGGAPPLAASVHSVMAQTCAAWDMVVVVDPADVSAARAALAEAAAPSARIKLCDVSSYGSTAAACNNALAHAEGDWVVLMAAGDVLPPHALAHLAAEIVDHRDARIIYSDEDALDAKGARVEPRFKPDWNVDLFYSQDLVSGLGAFERGLVGAVGGFREGFDGAMGYDLTLRCIEGLRPGQIRRIPRVLCHRSSADATPVPAVARVEASALAQHFDRTGTAARVLESEAGRRVQYQLPSDLPLVTLIIPTRNAEPLLRQCVESIVGATTYPNYEILLIDNGSDQPDALAYLASLNGQPGITVIRDDRPFNYSALNNMGVGHARGDLVGLVNNDIEVISPDWLGEMVSLALQPGVGAVGAKLLYPDETVQHGGVLLGVGGEFGVAGHANKFLPAWQGGYMNRGLAIQSFSAVTAACLVVRKALYEQVGGLNEVDLKVAYNDVDFCLRLREAGYRNVWTPHAELFHHESATRGADVTPAQRERFDQEHAYMRKRWGDLIANDPAYNPNLTIHAENFGLAWPPRVPWISGAAKP